MSQRTLVTAALPYANGPIHMGHLVGYCMTDMYVRAQKALGHQAFYICANDAHGTPIEVNASQQNIAPEVLVERIHREHIRDFKLFGVAFDYFGTTHSDTNKNLVETVYAQLKGAGELVEREVDGNWCDTDQRFLPDRFVKGGCPRCQAEDQYGDVCEKCSATYTPTDLIAPYCVMCHKAPVTKRSNHVFFKLSSPEHIQFLRQWIDSGALQPDVANYVRHWLDSGLRDWCISRDGPYFGFSIPDMPGKYFYVWLDAPFGYVAASLEWGKKHGLGIKELWHSKQTRIEHIIGKDIMYFHTLFWPAILHAANYTLPNAVCVHGMLTVNGEKMSKSRGTFITAATFAEHIPAEALRFYYASKYTAHSYDMDLSFDDFLGRVNGELVNKHANLFSRVSQFLHQKLQARLGDLPFAAEQAHADFSKDGSMLDLARQVTSIARRIELLYMQRDIAQVVRELAAIADLGNEYMQTHKPWAQLKADIEQARLTCTFVLNVCYALAMYLQPILPDFAAAALRILGTDNDLVGRMDAALLFKHRQRQIGPLERLFERIEPKAIEALIKASSVPAAPPHRAPESASLQTQVQFDTPLMSFEQFSSMDLRAATILQAQAVPKSSKLLRLSVDLGEAQPRQIISGLAQAYEPEALVGTQVLVVVNLKPAKIMGHLSQGMVLAAGSAPNLSLCRLDKRLAPGTKIS